ncbi:MAG: anhydro-N-acetylmuramic acid kinase [Gammaproteobacteria bacterium]
MQLFIGLMSGTSSDAIDVALVSFDECESSILNIETYQEFPYPPHLKKQITEMRISANRFSFEEIEKLNIRLGEIFANVVHQLLESTDFDHKDILAIGSHGQTVFHSPDSSPPFSVQLGDPNTIAAITGIKTIGDFRSMDIAVGGQGAPLAPAFHQTMFKTIDKNRIILNLGGIANITLLPASPSKDIFGFDTGPANALLDDWIQKNQRESFDRNGEWAKTGNVIPTLLKAMLEDAYFRIVPPKSTGREYFNLDWLDKKIGVDNYKPEDIQATLLLLTVQSITNAIDSLAIDLDEVIVCGGGAYNNYLIDLLSRSLHGIPVTSSTNFGIEPDSVEAVAFAWLAKRRLDNLPGNIPSVTGATKEVLLGAIYG